MTTPIKPTPNIRGLTKEQNAFAQLKAYINYLETQGIAPPRPTEVQEAINTVGRHLTKEQPND